MSVKLMSAIFETEFRDLTDADGNTTKASTAKSVCLALADHANDEGEGAYPGLTKMEVKTALSRQAVINAYDALKYNGIIFLEGVSKLGTNDYTINVGAFPGAMERGKPGLLVISVDPPSQPGLPPLVNPDYPNHPLTTLKTRLTPLKTDELPIEWQIAGRVEEVVIPDDAIARRVDFANWVGVGTSNPQIAREIAMAFQTQRDITLPESSVKGQRKAIKQMLEMGVNGSHVTRATRQLVDKGMTVVDLFSVIKTAVDLANKPEEKIEYTRTL